MSNNTQRDQERGVALAQAVAAVNGGLDIAGQANGDLLVYDALQAKYVPLIPGVAGTVLESQGPGQVPVWAGGGGPPGTWVQLASGTVALSNNSNTTIASFARGAGQRIIVFPPTPVSDAFGSNGVLSDNTNLGPGLGTTLWWIQENGAGLYLLQARQNNSGAAARSYEYVVYGVVP